MASCIDIVAPPSPIPLPVRMVAGGKHTLALRLSPSIRAVALPVSSASIFAVLVTHGVHADRRRPFTACGITTSGYTAAVNTFAFGAFSASGDACGRCFKITSNKDPYSTSYPGPFNSIVVRVSNLCPIDGNEQWCGQTASNPVNQFGTSMQCVTCPAFQLEPRCAENETNRSFDLCEDSGTGTAFFPSGRGAMLGTFEEVACEGNWSGSEGGSLWDGSCMANATTGLWPARGCGNQGRKHSLACTVMQFWLIFILRNPAPVSGWHEIWHYGKSCSYYGREVY
jgi:hypothetical protein